MNFVKSVRLSCELELNGSELNIVKLCHIRTAHGGKKELVRTSKQVHSLHVNILSREIRNLCTEYKLSLIRAKEQ